MCYKCLKNLYIFGNGQTNFYNDDEITEEVPNPFTSASGCKGSKCSSNKSSCGGQCGGCGSKEKSNNKHSECNCGKGKDCCKSKGKLDNNGRKNCIECGEKTIKYALFTSVIDVCPVCELGREPKRVKLYGTYSDD